MFSTNASQVSSAAAYIEDVFSTWLYTGNGGTQTITNGIDLAGKGGLVWLKSRNTNAIGNGLFDSARGFTGTNFLSSNTASAASSESSFAGVSSTGFSLAAGNYNSSNTSFNQYVSWTFRKQAKFFDVVTYTGDGTSSKTISHNLGSTPGCIIIKPLQDTGIPNFNNWRVWHRSLTSQSYQLILNDTSAEANIGNFISQNSTTFTIGFNAVNYSGIQYVAYLFAHNAGGFGLTGTDNVISCGSFTTSSGVATVNLGYEPQYVLYRLSSANDDWWISDNMRGMSMTQNNGLFADLSAAESNQYPYGVTPTSTGFTYNIGAGTYTVIYIAIRRGPMKTPTSGTSVFAPVARAGTGSATTERTGLNGVDLAFTIPRNAAGNNWSWVDRLRGGVAGSAARIQSNTTTQEFTDGPMSVMANIQDQLTYNGNGYNQSGTNYIVECFKRAPGFFDEVCYTGTGTNLTVSHNLAAVPELMIVKSRVPVSLTDTGWYVYASAIGPGNVLSLNSTTGVIPNTVLFKNTNPTSSVFSVGGSNGLSSAGTTYVAYLFASCPGVSKVGSYTGTGATQTISCGFTGGARFVLIKRTDTTGDWYVWDTARGMVSGIDPSLLLNSTAAEVNANSVYTTTGGFQIVSTAAGINASGGSYIFLAIA